VFASTLVAADNVNGAGAGLSPPPPHATTMHTHSTIASIRPRRMRPFIAKIPFAALGRLSIIRQYSLLEPAPSILPALKQFAKSRSISGQRALLILRNKLNQVRARGSLPTSAATIGRACRSPAATKIRQETVLALGGDNPVPHSSPSERNAGRAAGSMFRDCPECPQIEVVPAGN
jgi:hypothetical protein